MALLSCSCEQSREADRIHEANLARPIIQAPMAGVSTIELAAQVTLSGGLGSLALSGVDLRKGPQEFERIMTNFRQALQRDARHRNTVQRTPVNVNFFCHDILEPPTEEMMRNWKTTYSRIVANLPHDKISFTNGNVSFKEFEDHPEFENWITVFKKKPELVPVMASFHFGCPQVETVRKLQKLGILVVVTITSADELEYCLKRNVDGVVCQGYEAGGHRGTFLADSTTDTRLSTRALFEETLRIVGRKTGFWIIPAGGIMNARTVRSYMDAGATAVQLGSVFLTCPEVQPSGKFIADIIENQKEELYRTEMVDLVSGKPARTVVTPFISQLKEAAVQPLPAYGYRYNAYKNLKAISHQVTSMDIGFYLAGQNFYANTNVNRHAKVLVESLCREL